MKTGEQIEVYFFKKTEAGKLLFLLAKRVHERGGFWQPMTGGVEQGETFEQTIRRESQEEFGFAKINRIIDTGYRFSFADENGEHTEYIYGAEVDADAEPTLSHEHDEFKWLEKDEALNFLKWPGNKTGLEKLHEALKV